MHAVRGRDRPPVQALSATSPSRGMKVTPSRRRLFRELAASTAHPDAETVFQTVSRRVRGLSRDTVYRTLATLEDGGLIRKVEPLSGSTRYDANLDRHHHFVCTACGKVHDFYSEGWTVAHPQVAGVRGRDRISPSPGSRNLLGLHGSQDKRAAAQIAIVSPMAPHVYGWRFRVRSWKEGDLPCQRRSRPHDERSENYE